MSYALKVPIPNNFPRPSLSYPLTKSDNRNLFISKAMLPDEKIQVAMFRFFRSGVIDSNRIFLTDPEVVPGFFINFNYILN
jgi:hypothetical protein